MIKLLDNIHTALLAFIIVCDDLEIISLNYSQPLSDPQ